MCRLKYLVTACLEIVTARIWRSRSSLTNFNLKSLNATDSERPRAAEDPTASCYDFTCTSKRQFFHAGGDPDMSYLWCGLSKTYLLKLWSCRLFTPVAERFPPPSESGLSHCVNVTRSSPRTRSDARALFTRLLRRQEEPKSRRLCSHLRVVFFVSFLIMFPRSVGRANYQLSSHQSKQHQHLAKSAKPTCSPPPHWSVRD